MKKYIQSIRHKLYIIFFLAWREASKLSREGKGNVIYIYMRYLNCRFKVHMSLQEFADLMIQTPDRRSFNAKIAEIIECDRFMKNWIRGYFKNWRFLTKFSSMKYDASPKMLAERIRAYRKRYDIGKRAYIQYGVKIIAEHFSNGRFKVGDDVLLARDVDLDTTGDLEIMDGAKILEGAKILTHAHDLLHMKDDRKLIRYSNRAYVTPLVIGRNVHVCARAIILPGVMKIGDNSMVSSGAVVTRQVPPNVIVAGNPAKVVAEIPEGIELKAEFLK